MILASAGSGKTWQLTNRYIALMALQWKSRQEVAPERILAATFTVKAAGEFFTAILKKLARAAIDPKEAAVLSSDKSDPLAGILASLTPQEYTHLLRVFISRMPQIFLGTLDGFFARLLGAFPSEFGLNSDYITMDDFATATARAEVIEAVFSRRTDGRGRGSFDQTAFLEAFRLAMMEKEEASLSSSLNEFIEELHELYLMAPEPEKWGHAEVIWPDGCEWLGHEIDPKTETTRLRRALEATEASGGKVKWDDWNRLINEIADYTPGYSMEGKIKYVAEKVLPLWSDLINGSITLKFNRTEQELGPDVCDPLRRIFQWMIGGELKKKLARTQGIHSLLQRYEDDYGDLVRRHGRLTFQDVQFLLSGRDVHSTKARFSQNSDDDARLRIDYRLDARYDHWLLDEFQDTNMLQWRVIENLIDEVIQDTSGTRSLFQVGDLKQAIYAFRGGDTRLLSEITRRYNAHREIIHQRPLDVSWRSGHDVITPVNQVFGDRSVLTSLLPSATVEQWRWNDHLVSKPGEKYEGITYYLYSSTNGDRSKDTIAPLVAGILSEIDPVRRGISCAILVQGNKTVNSLVAELRKATDVPVMGGSEISIVSDNPMNRTLRSLFQLASHPSDTYAWQHILLSPLRRWVEAENAHSWSVSKIILESVFEFGFERTAREWIARIKGCLDTTLDDFTSRRAEEFALAARGFDETDERDIDAFLRFLEHYRIREGASAGFVQVMTIHQSKGLTFDAVILPELTGNSLDTISRDIGKKLDAHREVEWVLDMPRKDFAQIDPVLRVYREECESDAAYDALCKFYVAMTRAARANYLVTPPPPKKSESNNFIMLLEETLGASNDQAELPETNFSGVPALIRYQSQTPQTNRQWYESFQRKAPSPTVSTPPDPLDAALARKLIRRGTPSGSGDAAVTAQALLSRGGSRARERGTLVHAIFEEIEWADTIDWITVEAGCRLQFPESEGLEAAIEHVQAALEIPAFHTALAWPMGNIELWREKRFEILLEHQWLSGVFDRVHIERDPTGRAIAATVLDFKTDYVTTPNEIAAAVAHHRPQIESYKKVLRRILDLGEDDVHGKLLFTQPREVCVV